MISESSSFDFPDADTSQQYFESIATVVGNLAEQNKRYELTAELGDQDFISLAKQGITDEQTATVDLLSSMSDAFAYGSLSNEADDAENAVDGLRQQIVTARARLATAHSKIDAMAETTTRLSPKSAKSVADLAETKKKAIDTTELNALLEALANATKERDQVLGVFALAGEAWPVPLALQTNAIAVAQSSAVEQPVAIDAKDIERQAQVERSDGDLCRLVVAGDHEAGIEFFHKYRRLIRFMAKKIQPDTPFGGEKVYSHQDATQDAWVYMIELAGRYDAAREVPFASFANMFILQMLSKKLDVGIGHGANVPDNARTMLRTMYSINDERIANRRPLMTRSEIAKEFGVAMCGTAGRIGVDDLERAMMLTRYMGSLDNGFSPQTDSSPGNSYIADERNPMEPITGELPQEVDTAIHETLLKDDINALLDTLDPEDARYLRIRFGIGGVQKATAEMAAVLGVAQSRIQSLDNKSLANVRKKKDVLPGLYPHLNDSKRDTTDADIDYSLTQPIDKPQTAAESYHNYALAAEEQLTRYGLTKLTRLVRKKPTDEVLEEILQIFTVNSDVDLQPKMQHINLFQAILPHLQKRYDLSKSPTAVYAQTRYRDEWKIGLQLLSKLEKEWSWQHSVVAVQQL